MTSISAAQTVEGPYQDESTNLIYQLLFCDRAELFKQHYSAELREPWTTLFGTSPDVVAIRIRDRGSD